MVLRFCLEKMIKLVLWFCWILLIYVNGLPLPKVEYRKVPSSDVLDFMKRFGYLEQDIANSEALYTEEGISEAVKNIQKYGAIPESGILDNATLKLMSSPRCGVPDIIRKRRKRYAFGSKGWNKRQITYFIANWSPSLGEHLVIKNIQLALDTWGKYGRLTFHRVQSPNADIIVAFGRGYHGDSFPFDGPGNILAHAFFPYEYTSFGGDIHFDDDETWVDLKHGGSGEGTDFFTVALHELGHSLGLAHSTVANSVMFPYYQGFDPSSNFQLEYDDILGMYELYIRRNVDGDSNSTFFPPEESTTETTFTTTSLTEFTTKYVHHKEDNSTITYEGDDESVEDHKKHERRKKGKDQDAPNVCEGYFDAVATLREELFIFKRQYVWRLKERGRIQPGYPIPLTQLFPKLPKSVKYIDAAYERPDGMIILFTGNHFWVYDGKDFIENSPKSISHYGLPSNLENIDAVQIWGRNKKTYFYKGNKFWRYNETSKLMDKGYPMHMERWRGAPEDLDAATTWKDGFTYFFREELYWKFDNDWIITTEESPLPTPEIWLGCPENAKNLARLSRF